MTSTGILKNGMYMLFSIFLFCNCTGSSVKPHSTAGLSGNQPHTDTILITDMKFQPDIINVQQGDTIVWLNHDMVAHCVTSKGDNPWTSSAILPGGSWKMKVDGNSDYFCAIHQVMKGKIEVK